MISSKDVELTAMFIVFSSNYFRTEEVLLSKKINKLITDEGFELLALTVSYLKR